MGRVFGESKREIWRSLSEQMGAQYVEGGFLGSRDRVIVRRNNWTFTLDTYTVSSGKSSTTFTRMRVPYVNADGFRFSIYKSNLFTKLFEWLGFHDVKIGDDEFDRDYVIKARDEEKVRDLLDDKLRELIREQPRFRLEVKGFFRKSVSNHVDELYFRVPGVIKDTDRLKGLFEILAEMMDHLSKIGSAYPDDSGLKE